MELELPFPEVHRQSKRCARNSHFLKEDKSSVRTGQRDAGGQNCHQTVTAINTETGDYALIDLSQGPRHSPKRQAGFLSWGWCGFLCAVVTVLAHVKFAVVAPRSALTYKPEVGKLVVEPVVVRDAAEHIYAMRGIGNFHVKGNRGAYLEDVARADHGDVGGCRFSPLLENAVGVLHGRGSYLQPVGEMLRRNLSEVLQEYESHRVKKSRIDGFIFNVDRFHQRVSAQLALGSSFRSEGETFGRLKRPIV